ncbi:MAG: peroxidase-related enzyme [Gemmatimonadota bacterium]|jgi:uncharacterized peroxidase-related enzyme
MSWIATIPEDEADGRLRRLYERVAGPDGKVDNILRVHSLRPHTLEGHLGLYKAALHHTGNVLPVWLLEVVGIQVSLINGCDYCVAHHYAGLCRLIGEVAARPIRAALESGERPPGFEAREGALLAYSERLTRTPSAVTAADIAALRAAGFDDGEIVEVNQVASYFAYANRTVQGLGVTTAGDVLGRSPGGSDPADWSHG